LMGVTASSSKGHAKAKNSSKKFPVSLKFHLARIGDAEKIGPKVNIPNNNWIKKLRVLRHA
jgi:hypothetical protein